MNADEPPSGPAPIRGAAAFPLREATVADAAAILEINRASVRELCATHYDADLLERWMSGRTPELYARLIAEEGDFVVCDHGGVVVGFSHTQPDRILAIYVHPAHAGHGLGTALLARAIRDASRGPGDAITLSSSLNAVAFYRHHGFHEGRRTEMSRNGLTFPVVEMHLPKPARAAAPSTRTP